MSVTITSSYAGQFAGKYIAASLLAAKTIDDGAITVLPNIKYKAAMKVGAFSNLIKGASCDFDTATSSLALTEKVLTPKELQVNIDICKKDLHSDWEAAQMGFSAFDNLPPLFSDFVISRVAAEVASSTETSIWDGASGADNFDGLRALALADGTVNDVTGTASTSANVVAELGKIVDAIPSGVYGADDLYIYVSQNIFKSYVRALGGFAATNSGVDAKSHTFYNGGELSFDGVKLYPTSGLRDNCAIAARQSNLFFGTGLLDDRNEVRVIDMAENDGSQNVRIVMRYTAGVQIGVGADVVLYD
jgi:hypothetical protein|tara:strand:+ start:669 stop:1580 length:912 start_codon:yes stop_codon:yes gene_type:complete